eukprot:m.1603288 g.1603288  ORF g.1603288 m.1603288 type:complete len:934 (+) comp25355_c1_seq28:378-3179(+)
MTQAIRSKIFFVETSSSSRITSFFQKHTSSLFLPGVETAASTTKRLCGSDQTNFRSAWAVSSICPAVPASAQTPRWSISTTGSHTIPSATYAAFLESRFPIIQSSVFVLNQLYSGVTIGGGGRLNVTAIEDALRNMHTQLEAMQRALNVLEDASYPFPNQLNQLQSALAKTAQLQSQALNDASAMDVLNEYVANCSYPFTDLWLSLDSCPAGLCSLARATNLIDQATVDSIPCQTHQSTTSIEYICGSSVDEPVLDVGRSVEHTSAVSLTVAHACFCAPLPALSSCSSAKRAQLKAQDFDNTVHSVQATISTASLFLVLFIMYKEFKHQSDALQKHAGFSTFWHRLRTIGVPVESVQLLSNVWGLEHVAQTASAWFMIYTIFVYRVFGLSVASSSTSDYEFAYQIMFMYLPLTVCDATRFQRLGSCLGLMYCFLLIAEVVLELQKPKPAEYFHWMVSVSFPMYFVPLVGVMCVFAKKIWTLHFTSNSHTRPCTDTDPGSHPEIKPVEKKWYYKYVSLLVNIGPSATANSIPLSLRIKTAVSVSGVFVVWIGSVMLCIFIYYIPQLPRLLSGPVCYLGYNPNATNADLWSELADEANGPTSQSSLGLGLKCKTAKVIMKAVYGVTVGCWILSVLVALVQLRFLSKKYIRDLTAVVRGSIVPFPRGKRPRPFYALYKCTTFIGAQVIGIAIGLLVFFSVLWLVFLALTLVFVLPYVPGITYPVIVHGRDVLNAFINVDEHSLGWLSIMIILFFTPRLIVRFFLIVDRHSVQIRNRRNFSFFDFYMMAFGMVIGLFSFLKRIAFSMSLNLTQLFRTDTCVTPQGFESYDSAYMAYIGLLEVDRFYSNPTLLLFVDLLLQSAARRDRIGAGLSTYEREDDQLLSIHGDMYGLGPSRAAKRWHVAYSKIRNPALNSHTSTATQHAPIAEFPMSPTSVI